MMVKEYLKTTIDHDEIRAWAAQRGVRPGFDEEGRPGFALPGEPGLAPASWQDFFVAFEEHALALSFEEGGDFFELVRRERLDELAERGTLY